MDPSSNPGAVLITGAARRIGAAIAEAMAADGWYVIIHHHHSVDQAAGLLARIEAAGGRGRAVRADLADAEALAGLLAAATDGAPPLRCLINNASLFQYDTLASMTAETWQANHAVNLRAPLFLARDFANNLPSGADGVIVNLLDNKLFALNPDFLSYTVAKYALLGATRVLAMELAPRVRVCGIAPGITLPSSNQSEENFTKAQAMNPLGRGCSPAQIVAALRFILAAPSLTGEVITIDGGQSLLGLPRDVSFMTDD